MRQGWCSQKLESLESFCFVCTLPLQIGWFTHRFTIPVSQRCIFWYGNACFDHIFSFLFSFTSCCRFYLLCIILSLICGERLIPCYSLAGNNVWNVTHFRVQIERVCIWSSWMTKLFFWVMHMNIQKYKMCSRRHR